MPTDSRRIARLVVCTKFLPTSRASYLVAVGAKRRSRFDAENVIGYDIRNATLGQLHSLNNEITRCLKKEIERKEGKMNFTTISTLNYHLN